LAKISSSASDSTARLLRIPEATASENHGSRRHWPRDSGPYWQAFLTVGSGPPALVPSTDRWSQLSNRSVRREKLFRPPPPPLTETIIIAFRYENGGKRVFARNVRFEIHLAHSKNVWGQITWPRKRVNLTDQLVFITSTIRRQMTQTGGSHICVPFPKLYDYYSLDDIVFRLSTGPTPVSSRWNASTATDRSAIRAIWISTCDYTPKETHRTSALLPRGEIIFSSLRLCRTVTNAVSLLQVRLLRQNTGAQKGLGQAHEVKARADNAEKLV
jgi:hypothetical protein